MLTVRRRGAEKEVPGNDVVDLAGVRGAEGAVERERQELSLLVADKSHWFLEGIDRLDGAADGVLHGGEGVVNGDFLRLLTRGDKQNCHGKFLHKMRELPGAMPRAASWL